MGFLDAIVGGVTGFFTGGPVGAGVGLLSGALGSSGARPTAGGAGMVSSPSYADTLRQVAYMRSFLDAAGPPGFVPEGTAYATTQQQQQKAQGSVRNAKQQGGQGDRSPANIMRRRLAQDEGMGGGGGGGAGGDLTKKLSMQEWLNQMPGRAGAQQQTTTSTPAAPNNEQLFQNYLQAGIQGQSTLPASAYQQAMARGVEGINQQAAQSRMMLQRNLGSRGLLHSGLYARGFGEVERGRLGGIADLSYDLQAQELSARRRSQETAANILAQQFLTREQLAAQAEQIRMQQPTTGDYLASLAGSAAQYFLGRSSPNYTSFLSQPSSVGAGGIDLSNNPAYYQGGRMTI